MFGMGLTLSVDDFREVVKRPFDVTIGVLGQFLIMPLLAVLLTLIIPMPPEVAAGVILVGCCPGGTSSNVMTYLFKGDVALSVACTSVTTLAAPLVTPFLVWLFASQFLPVDGWAMFLSIVKVVLVPLALGAALQKLLPGLVKTAVPALPLVSVIGIVLIVAAVVGGSKASIAQSGLMIFAVVVLHNGLGYLLGYLAAKATGLSLAKQGHCDRGRHAEFGPWRGTFNGLFFASRCGSERHFQRLAQYFRCNPGKLVFRPCRRRLRQQSRLKLTICQAACRSGGLTLP